MQLIPRLYDASRGTVRVGGRDVRDYDLRALRDAVGIVLQKNVLFSGTIRENLLWGNPEADDDTLWEACRKASADEFLERLPKGMDTDLGQGGVNVSGGQKQRLCIARTLLKKPKVLIFDDSTSAVDTATEGEIREALAKLTDVTKIIIAQRITSVMDTDQIIILDDGRIHAYGHSPGAAGKGFYLSGNLCFPDERRGGLMAKRQITGKKPKNFRYTVETLLSYLGRHKLLLLCGGGAGNSERPGEPAGNLYDPPGGQQPGLGGYGNADRRASRSPRCIYAVGVAAAYGYTQIMVKAAQKSAFRYPPRSVFPSANPSSALF